MLKKNFTINIVSRSVLIFSQFLIVGILAGSLDTKELAFWLIISQTLRLSLVVDIGIGNIFVRHLSKTAVRGYLIPLFHNSVIEILKFYIILGVCSSLFFSFYSYYGINLREQFIILLGSIFVFLRFAFKTVKIVNLSNEKIYLNDIGELVSAIMFLGYVYFINSSVHLIVIGFIASTLISDVLILFTLLAEKNTSFSASVTAKPKINLWKIRSEVTLGSITTLANVCTRYFIPAYIYVVMDNISSIVTSLSFMIIYASLPFLSTVAKTASSRSAKKEFSYAAFRKLSILQFGICAIFGILLIILFPLIEIFWRSLDDQVLEILEKNIFLIALTISLLSLSQLQRNIVIGRSGPFLTSITETIFFSVFFMIIYVCEYTDIIQILLTWVLLVFLKLIIYLTYNVYAMRGKFS